MNRTPKFTDQVVIVTGASSGIGKETVLAFAQQGAITVLSSRSEGKLNQVADECRKFHPQVRVVPADVTSAAQVKNLVDRVVNEFGRVDILINNAGGSVTGMIESPHFISDVRELFETDYIGKVYCAQAVLPIMRKQGQGCIVNLSSVVGRKAFPNFAAYSIAMHAVSAFSDALRQELAETGIHVATIHPALTETNFLHAFDKYGMPETFRYMTPLSAKSVANGILTAVIKKQPRVIIPWQPRFVIASDGVSAALGDLQVRLMKHRFFMTLIGMYKGRAYQVDHAK